MQLNAESPFKRAFEQLSAIEDKREQMRITGGAEVDSKLRKKMKNAQSSLDITQWYAPRNLNTSSSMGDNMDAMIEWVRLNSISVDDFAQNHPSDLKNMPPSDLD